MVSAMVTTHLGLRLPTGNCLQRGTRPTITSGSIEPAKRARTFVAEKLFVAPLCGGAPFSGQPLLRLYSASHAFCGLSSSSRCLMKQRSSKHKIRRGTASSSGSEPYAESYAEDGEPECSEDEIEAFTIVHVGYETTGLPMYIWISPNIREEGVPRLRVSRSYGQMLYRDWFTMTIEDNPATIGDTGNIGLDDVLLVKRFISKNRAVTLERFWQEEFDSSELIESLQKV